MFNIHLKKILSCLLCISAVLTALTYIAVSAEASDSVVLPAGGSDGGYIYAELGNQMREKLLDFSNYTFDSSREAYKIAFNLYDYKIPSTDIKTFVDSFLKHYTEIFFLKLSYSYSRAGDYLYSVYFYLNGTPDEVKAQIADFSARAEKLVTAAKEIDGEAERALWVHDRIVLNCVYNEDVLLNLDPQDSVYTAYGALCEENAVCQGYSYLYKYIMNRLGISACIVASTELNHSWNIVKIGSYWYHVDVTWDDPAWDMVGRVYHNNFLLSDDGIKATSTSHSSWDDLSSALQTSTEFTTSTTYESRAWRNLKYSIEHRDGQWYYSTGYGSSCEILRTSDIDSDTLDTQRVLKKAAYWYAPSGGYYMFSFGIAIYGNTLYFNTSDAIYSVNLDGTNETSVFTYTKPYNYMNLYGLRVRDGAIYYSLCDSYSGDRTENRVQIAAQSLFYNRYTDENGIIYTLDQSTKTARVGNTSGVSGNAMSKSLVAVCLPKQITSGSVTYKITEICDGAFAYVGSLELTVEGDEPKASEKAFDGSDVTVYYNSSDSSWNAADEWHGVRAVDTAVKLPNTDPNGDGVTDIKDVLVLDAYVYGKRSGDLSACDLNGDGVVDVSDVILLAAIATGAVGD